MIRYRPRAVDSVEDAADYLAEDSLVSAERLLLRVDETLRILERMPRMGRSWPRPPGPLKGLRACLVNGFPNHLVFYRPIIGGIEFVKLIHGRRDIRSVLDE